MDDIDIFQSNRKSTLRLRTIMEKLSDKDLFKKVGSEWNVSLTLAHIAFWDQRAIFVIESAIKNNKLHVPYYDDQLNDILPPIFSLIPPRDVERLIIETAEKLDDKLEKCPKDLLNEIKKVNIRLIDRSIHRNLHLDEIEKALK
jgi:hypothetical protein